METQKKYVVSTETVTKKEMTSRENSIFNHGYKEGFEDGIEAERIGRLITTILGGSIVGIIIFLLLKVTTN